MSGCKRTRGPIEHRDAADPGAITLPYKGSDIQTLNSKLSMARGVADVLH